jgi:hypothetical protein
LRQEAFQRVEPIVRVEAGARARLFEKTSQRFQAVGDLQRMLSVAAGSEIGR